MQRGSVKGAFFAFYTFTDCIIKLTDKTNLAFCLLK